MIEKERGKFPEGVTGSPIRKIGYFGWKTWELAFRRFPYPGLDGNRAKRDAVSTR